MQTHYQLLYTLHVYLIGYYQKLDKDSKILLYII